jgi:hypothetical protein
VLDVAPPGRGAHLREALDGVLRALDLVATHYALPITANDRDANGEIVAHEILEHLRAVVAELSERSGATDRGER